MTSQTFNNRILAIVFFLMATVSINAQQTAPMRALIGQSLSKMQQSDPQSVLNAIAELKRIDAMFPDSIQPKYQIALQSLVYAVSNPKAESTNNLVAETEQTINKLGDMKQMDQSDLFTLRGFLDMVRIVQNPAQNGQRYYLSVMENFDKALKSIPITLLPSSCSRSSKKG